MFSVKDPRSRLLRWRLLLEEYDYTIAYQAGKKNVNADILNADALSRNPVVMTVMITSKEKQRKILKEMHEFPIGGHQVVQRTYDRLKLYRVSQEECARLQECVPYVKVYRYNPKHLCSKLNGYGVNGQRKVWYSCGSTHCTCRLTILYISVLECGVI